MVLPDQRFLESPGIPDQWLDSTRRFPTRGPTRTSSITGVFGLPRDARLSFAMLLLTGALDNISVVVRGTLVQALTPDAMRGRVSAVNAVFIGSSNELGGFESGLTAQLVGPVVSVVAGGIGTILVVLAVALIRPPVRRLGSLHQVGRPEGVGTGRSRGDGRSLR